MTLLKKGLIPIQIIGTQRSGSNLLRLILNQSPLISAHHPPHILKVFYPILHKYDDLKEHANFKRLIHDVCRLVETNPVKWDIKLDREKVFRRCEKPTLIEVFKAVYETMALKDNAAFWCCKSMSNVNFYEPIEDNGMEPYYIHLIRDGRDVAASFKKTLVGEKHIFHLASIWKNNYLKAKKAFENIDRNRCLTIKYESLIANPIEVLEQINGFLGLHLDETVLDYFNSNESKITAAAGYMWSNLTMPIMPNNSRKFLEVLTPEEIEIFEHVAGDLLIENDYALVAKFENKAFSDQLIREFDAENIKLKKEAMLSNHLKVDRLCRQERNKLLIELNK
ncbi:sulfotransferase [Sabulilitoribacter arenilitoris]|uniref:Sulfotransferase n=1 Tax=Wocania arenilitoris TaxID=2044858 RepID=A0AAE3EN05_9FLAO|nr:sulfotransferase [Wocania arenilitoris]MCF7567064.1 sulfotransferase [Wocania arenilitoris]